MIFLFLPAALMFVAMLVISMAPIFHFTSSKNGKQWHFRSLSRLTAMRVRKGSEALQEQVALEPAVVLEPMV
ncbi:hypothetical protein Terro_4053 [Terriglobus roseus DSM 18391]|uniref:Uncharacterized protein n=1 Tax=Terriglobus roseus (strain DSM 18391 / NRRL B-41598 / KBS 63) TaxID=926566 RepID=I3ZLZ2_TERRK|nr:hypothetical protein [Terriglobus roseus]AFL90260.1 hypothetical protein Terro_4053 [Terriglobus roseus DSM 18391]